MSDSQDFDIEMVDNEAIKQLLDVTTGACSFCGQASKVPEDVVGVMQHGQTGRNIAMIVCEDCQPAFAVWMEAQF